MAKKTDGVFIPTGAADGSCTATADVMRSKGQFVGKAKTDRIAKRGKLTDKQLKASAIGVLALPEASE